MSDLSLLNAHRIEQHYRARSSNQKESPRATVPFSHAHIIIFTFPPKTSHITAGTHYPFLDLAFLEGNATYPDGLGFKTRFTHYNHGSEITLGSQVTQLPVNSIPLSIKLGIKFPTF